MAANQEWLVVLPEERGAVWVPRPEVETIREVPERVVLPASSAESLERALDPTWPGLRRARLGGWVLRQGSGVTGRANSVLAVGDPEVPFEEALSLAGGWYEGPVTLQAVVDGRRAAEALAAGFVAAKPTIVQTRSVAGPPAADPEVVGEDAPDGVWRSICGVSGGLLSEVTAAPARYLRLDERAAGRVAVAGQWAVLTCVAVIERERGRGLGRRITRALLAEAARLGARFAALQVEESNAAAISLYASEGFEEHHRYCYLSRPR
ncbi:GNAT family N-acetyltransferase [Tessaracoccus aquimaris]|uniref:GNAT family N-acetyltransferase n=1 Tax=Tessaracoccus aquimaris TaxID=1332264 RepID=UPI0009890203|nr:GNAT family N-acetyltransferase [Tessaracoccus aquimaris]